MLILWTRRQSVQIAGRKIRITTTACYCVVRDARVPDLPGVESEWGPGMSEILTKPRREFKNIGLGQILFNYRLPLAGRTSILHRVSGVLLFVPLPFLL
jgi:hypothetical protein